MLQLYDIPICSANQARYRNGNRTKKARLYSDSIHREMLSFSAEIAEFKRVWRDKEDSLKELVLDITILVPQGRMRTKEGVISRRGVDLDNTLKLLIDALMDSRFRGRELKGSKDTVVTLDMDDKFITNLNVTKQENPNPESKLWDIGIIMRVV